MTQAELTDKCQAVTQASLELIAEQGFHGTPMSQIAKRAGVGVGSIYRYFSDKDELIHALHACIDEKMQQALIDTLDPEQSDRDVFIRLIFNLVRYLCDNPLEFKFLEQYYNSPFGVEKKREKLLDEKVVCGDKEMPFLQVLARGKGKTIKDLPMPVIHALAFGPVIFSVRDQLAGLIELDEALIRKLAEASWDAIKI